MGVSSPTSTQALKFDATFEHNGRQLRTFVLAGGCFWCLDAVYQRTTGVHAVISGYLGGHVAAPSYEQVCTGMSGHAEAVAVIFDETQVPAEIILDMFFTLHDPTTLNRQGHDVGTQYRSAMFPLDAAQRTEFQAAIDKFARMYRDPIVTTMEPVGEFWLAEDVHQDYYTNYAASGYCRVIIDPKLAKVKQHYGQWLRAE